jgi:N-acetyl-gamma-glutamyl-phosphate reductase
MKAAVIGGSGYLGAELLRLLAGHPELEVAHVQAASSAGSPLGAIYPGLEVAYPGVAYTPTDVDAVLGSDVVFVAVPSGRSQPIVQQLVDRVGVVVDLGADFRLKDPALYEQWYRFTHSCPELLGRAVYGLTELNREALGSAKLIASPGCYVTAASLALAPLVRSGAIERQGIIVDAASGTSGAGRELRESTHHATVNENFTAYGVLDHRHTPEIEQTIGAQVLFTPHLAPMTRGILATCYARPSASCSTDSLLDLLAEAYVDEPFIQVSTEVPATRQTYGANTVRITARYDERTGYVVVFSALDNLTKGGAGQALQSTNVALGLTETLGLSRIALLP